MKYSIWPEYRDQFCGTDKIYDYVTNPYLVENSVATIEMWLKRGLKIDYVEPNKGTMLSWAALNGRTEMVDFFLKSGADVNLANATGQTPLMGAVWHGSIISSLLKAGAQASLEDNYGNTALNYAIDALEEATKKRKEKWNSQPYDNEAYLMAKDVEESVNWVFCSVIWNFKPIKEKNGKIKKLSKNPLNLIIESEAIETLSKKSCLNTLKSNGFDPNEFYPNSFLTTKEAALQTKDEELILFVKYELLGLKDDQKLMRAVQKGDLKMVQDLIQNGADLNQTNESGQTALMEASIVGFIQMAETLIKAGADLLIKNKSGEDAYSLAMKNGHIEVAKMIKEAVKDELLALKKVTKQVKNQVVLKQLGSERER